MAGFEATSVADPSSERMHPLLPLDPSNAPESLILGDSGAANAITNTTLQSLYSMHGLSKPRADSAWVCYELYPLSKATIYH